MIPIQNRKNAVLDRQKGVLTEFCVQFWSLFHEPSLFKILSIDKKRLSENQDGVPSRNNLSIS